MTNRLADMFVFTMWIKTRMILYCGKFWPSDLKVVVEDAVGEQAPLNRKLLIIYGAGENMLRFGRRSGVNDSSSAFYYLPGFLNVYNPSRDCNGSR